MNLSYLIRCQTVFLPHHLALFLIKILHNETTADNILSRKVKELIALGVAITVRCNGCIAYHIHGVLSAGATCDEIMETISVAVLMGGGPSMVYGCEALEALEQFEAEFQSEAGLETSPA